MSHGTQRLDDHDPREVLAQYDTLEDYVQDKQEELEVIATGDFRSSWIAEKLLRAHTEEWQ
ncbi:hypothetical protein [Haladaptatus cibarius]|uniref:hypothetical protein n=1 Tax=Haladaptatus cibarius TaxID=453847 RepID=UPI000678F4D9|nr:hypothetical protein [Haladaptatus cibarius]